MTDLHLEHGNDGAVFCYRTLVLPSGARIPMAMSQTDADALGAVFRVRDAAKEWAEAAKTPYDAGPLVHAEVDLVAAVDALGGETT